MKEERQKVCFNYDLFLNQESDPPVSHLHHEKLTFNNKKHEFHRKLIQTAGVMVISEGTEMMPGAGADYSMLSTTALPAVSDHKKIKSHHATKEPTKDRAGGAGKDHKRYKPHREHKNSECKTRERVCGGGTSRLERSSSSSLKKSTENQEKEESKNVVNTVFKEPKFSTRESKGGGGGQVGLRAVSKRPSSTIESSDLSIKKLKSLKECKEVSSITVSSQLSSATAAPPSTCLEKKGMKEKSHWVKMRRESLVVKRWTDSDSNSEDETLSRSVQSGQSTSSSSCSTSSSDAEFEPWQMQNQGPLHSMVEHQRSEHSNDDRSSEVEKAMKAVPTIQDSRLFMDSDSDDVEESHAYSQKVPSHVLKLDTKNLKMLEKKNQNSCKRGNVLKGDTLGRAYTEELVDLHRRLMALRERNILQQIVNLIEKTGHFNVTKTTFDFDLFSLDESTVRKLQSYLQAKST